MSKAGLIVLLGVIALLVPLLGIPSGAKMALVVGIGILTALLGLLVREERRWLMRALSGGSTDAYTESAVGYAHLHEQASTEVAP